MTLEFLPNSSMFVQILCGLQSAEIGFDPRVSLREGIRKTLDWYRANRWL